MKYAAWVVVLLLSLSTQFARAEIVQIPQNCYAKGVYPCGLLIKYKVEEIKLNQVTVQSGAGSVLELRSKNESHLIRGEFLCVASIEGGSLSSLYGELKIQDGATLVQVQDSSVVLTNLSAKVDYQPRGEKKFYDLPKGFATSFAKVTKVGISETAFPRPAEIESLIASWAKFHSPETLPLLRSDLKDFMKDWTKATQLVKPWYEETVSREIASLREEERRRQEAREKTEAANQVYRRMFRDRVFNP